MKIAAGWPLPKVLIENEISSLEEMSNNSRLWEEQGELATAANQTFQVHRAKKKERLFGFSFTSWIEFPSSPVVKKACVECQIIVDPVSPKAYDMLTYSFGLFKENNQNVSHLVKKFHIDFTQVPDTGRAPLHPVFHLQAPGELSPFLKSQGIDDNHLEPSLSEPRLFHAPTTVALLTDLLLREFGSDSGSRLTDLTEEPRWKGLIRRNEELVLAPFFKACRKFFQDRKSKNDPERNQSFLQDFVYGKI